MYLNDTLCIKVGNKMTDFFTAKVGVRQGDVLSPNLFKFFINDLPQKLLDQSESVTLDNRKIPCLLYADDLVLMADSKRCDCLQNKLDILQEYCKTWCLDININKTKVVVFNNSGKLLNEEFLIGI